MASASSSPPVSNSSGMSSTTMSAPGAASASKKPWRSAPTSGWTMDSSRFNASGRPATRLARAARSTAPLTGHAREGRLDRRHRRAARAVERVHGGIGVVDRRRPPRRNMAQRRRLAHADGAGEADHDQGCQRSSARARASTSAGGGRPKKASKDWGWPGGSACRGHRPFAGPRLGAAARNGGAPAACRPCP